MHPEKFTERVRKVLNLARVEAQILKSPFIGTEHILLGIIAEGGGVAAKILQNLKNVTKPNILAEIDKLGLLKPSADEIIVGQIPYAPRAKAVIEAAHEAACLLGCDGIVATEHLLLALLKETEGIAVSVLTALGHKPDEIRDMVLDTLGTDVTPPTEEYAKILRTHLAGPPPPANIHYVRALEEVADIARMICNQVDHNGVPDTHVVDLVNRHLLPAIANLDRKTS